MAHRAIPGRAATIIVNWNGWADTAACVLSCQELEYPDNHLIVVDNGSIDGSVARLRERFAGLRVIETAANLGFAGGSNLGIRAALDDGAEFVWLLNSDTTVDPAALAELVAAMRERPGVGMAGSKIYYAAPPGVLWFAGGQYATRSGRAVNRGQDELDTGRYDSIEPVAFITGCSLLVRQSTIDQIGLLDASYFLYWEDVDWCTTAMAAGWGVAYVPGSRVWHKVGASIAAKGDLLQIRYDARNRILFYRRHLPARLWGVQTWACLSALSLLRRRASCRQGIAALRGTIDGLRGSTGPIDPGRWSCREARACR